MGLGYLFTCIVVFVEYPSRVPIFGKVIEYLLSFAT